MNIKINIVFNIREVATGGGNQFLKALRNGLRSMGVYAESPDQADVVLFNSHHFIDEIINLKKQHPELLIVHRVDGPIQLYNSPDDPRDAIIQISNRFLADGTIFQSEWSRRENRLLGFQPSRYETVIPNAPDPSIFNAEGKRRFSRSRKIRLIAISWSSNWKKGFDTYRWLDEHLDFSKYEMTFVGNSPVKFNKIRHNPTLDSRSLAKELKKYDIFITASQKDPCSNALIEALNCGLPAIALMDGGHPDIVKEGGEFFDHSEEIPALLERIVNNYKTYQQRIKLIEISEVIDNYYRFMHNIYSDNASGRYKPKKLTTFCYSRLVIALLWWKWQGRIRGRLTRAQDVELSRISPKLLLRNR
jgi:glycosyltransferase involved in cell wall biosynthesis